MEREAFSPFLIPAFVDGTIPPSLPGIARLGVLCVCIVLMRPLEIHEEPDSYHYVRMNQNVHVR